MKTLILILLCAFSAYSQCKALPDEEKKAMFDAHLIEEGAKNWNKTQHRLIEYGRTKILPTVYTEPDAKQIDRWWKQVRENFSAKEAREIFEQPGTVSTPNSLNDCSCSTTWTFCSGDNECIASSTCSKVINCGPFYAFQCNGKCQAS